MIPIGTPSIVGATNTVTFTGRTGNVETLTFWPTGGYVATIAVLSSAPIANVSLRLYSVDGAGTMIAASRSIGFECSYESVTYGGLCPMEPVDVSDMATSGVWYTLGSSVAIGCDSFRLIGGQQPPFVTVNLAFIQ
jgi:hypothetical protein